MTGADDARGFGIGHAYAVLTLVLLAFVGAHPQRAQADFGIQPGSLVATTVDADGDIATQAGAHSNAYSAFNLNLRPTASGDTLPVESIKDVRVDLPPGAIGDPTVGPKCSLADLGQEPPMCPPGAQVGRIELDLQGYLVYPSYPNWASIYNMDTPKGKTAVFGFRFQRNNVLITAEVRTEGDKGVTAVIHDIPGGAQLWGQRLWLWGVPGDPANDIRRCTQPNLGHGGLCTEAPGDSIVGPNSLGLRKPFWSTPATCGVTPVTHVAVTSWQHPDRWVTAETTSPAPTGCNKLLFEPTVDVTPTTTAPDAPTGLDVDIRIPQNDDPDGLATPPLKKAVVTLPEGMTINPSSAGGLDACTDKQLQLASRDTVTCPNSAKVGTVTATTPLLEEPLQGSVYVRSQASSDPESGDMFRLVLVLKNEERGLLMKLPGQVRANAQTGRLETIFDNNPQLPVSRVQLHLDGGSRAALATSPGCGTMSVATQLTSWGGQVADRQPSLNVDCTAGLGGFAPAFSAGTSNPIGGAFSPFALNITKPDGSAPLTGLSLRMPTGLLARLKGNLGTQVGTVQAFAGPGATPFMLPGKVFLEGRYGDAPFSLKAVVPAKAGPFDLGEVVVRQKIYVDPIDAHVTVVSDPVPTIVSGVPVRLQRLDVSVDKPDFMINPTSCDPKTIGAMLGSATGRSVPINVRFQVGGCESLAVKPSLALTLSGKGQTTDGKHPAVSAVLTQKPGQANLKKVRVSLPLSLALDPDNAASDDLCSFVEGSRPDPQCPASSIVGKATAVSPILNESLTGPVYFTKNERKDPKSGRSIKTTPKLVIPLVGENGVKLTLTGTSTVVDDQLVTTFDNIPDAPVSGFKMDINGGKKGILVVSGADICKATQVVDQQIDGQNNKGADADVSIQTPSCPLKVLSKKAGKSSVTLKVGGLGAGKVTVTGKGIKKTSKTIAKSTVATVVAKRTKGAVGKLTVSFDPAGPARARKTSK